MKPIFARRPKEERLGRKAAEPKAGGSRSRLGDDAPILAGEFGVGRDRSRRCEVEIALER